MENYIKIEQKATEALLDETEWEALGLDPNKGLLIMGPIGVGKSVLMNEYLKNKNRGHWLEPEDIKEGIETHGFSYFKQFRWDHLTFDDLGVEPKMVNVFGSEFFPGQELIDLRHSVFQRTAGQNRTCFTTNLNRDLLKEAYGERCYSRLVEMCNFIAVTGEDLRKL